MKHRPEPDLSDWDLGLPAFAEEREAFLSGLRAGLFIATMLAGVAGLVFASQGGF
jgi:hypothetical protein